MSDIDQNIENLSKVLVKQLMRIREIGLSQATIHQVKRCLLDYLGATYAGAEMIRDKAANLIGLEGTVSAIGFQRKASLESATFLNGFVSHVAEMDDGVRHGMIHPGSPIISALLPVAQRFEVDGEDLLTGVVVGYEAAVRLAAAMRPMHYELGYHPTGTCGAIGASLGVATMLRLDDVKTENALAAASVSASGSLKVIGEGSDLKPYNSAQAALSGLMAALTARAGFSGPSNALSGESGFLQMMSNKCNISEISKPADDGLWIHEVYTKPYAACRHAHPAVEASFILRKHTNLSPENINKIIITTYGGLAGRHDYVDANTIAEAKMSIPMATAIAFVTGKAGIEEFSKANITNPIVTKLASKVSIIEDPKLTSQIPEKREASVKCITKYGESRCATITYPKGEPENEMSDDELIQKYFDLTKYARINHERSQIIKNHVFNLPGSIKKLIYAL